MSDDERMQQQIAEIGGRYLRRTLSELPQMRALLERLVREPAQAAGLMQEIERMAHKIYGSGAMFGFDLVSGCAREVELVAGHRSCDAESIEVLRARITALEDEVRASASTRGIT
jgi:HPt (histidine-containing phosphotransfer) domain-containing protein